VEKEVFDNIDNFSENPPDVYGFGHKRFYEDVVCSLIQNRNSLIDGYEGRRSLALIHAIYESAATGRTIYKGDILTHSRLGK
jgi:hypothetical protein